MRDVRPPTILLVCSDESHRSAVARMLAVAGFWVMEAGSGDEGLRLAAKQPHLIVLDIELADLDGTEVCRRLKSDAVTSRVPVLQLSATRVAPHDRVHGLESGADAYLTQPCDPRELLATINSLLRMRNAEESARASAHDWQQTFNAISDAICMVDFQGRIVQYNLAMRELIGRDIKLRGRSVHQLLAEVLGADPAALPAIQGTYKRQTVEVPMRERWFRVTLDPVVSPDGVLLGAVKILSDITSHKRADEERGRLLAAEQQGRIELQNTVTALQETESRARQFFSSNLIGIVVGDSDGHVLEANDYFLKLIGYARDEIAQIDWRALSAPECRDLDARGMEELARYGICTPYEKTYIRRDRSRVPVLIGAAYFQGRADEHVAFILDMTERTREQAELRRAQERFRIAQELSLDAFNILRPVCDGAGAVLDFEFAYLNPAAAKIYGRTVEEMIGRHLLEVFPGTRAAGVFEAYARVWQTGEPHDLELFYDADGMNGWFRNMAIKLADGVAVSFSDITERKRAEAALRLNEKLAATGRLAASIAHEINNPMSSVTNLMYLLDTHPALDPKARQFVSMARQEVGRISHIVKQMLGFYRESPKPVPVNLCDILENVLDLFRHKADAMGISITKDFGCRDEVEAFPGEMRQVFTNLVGNALEAMAQGGKLFLRVSSGQDWHNGRRGIRVLVADNGQGIAPANLGHLFEPFFTTKGEKGTGLGLWVTNGIVRKHNGTIRVRSSTHSGRNGTAFSVFIPLQTNQRYLAKAAS